MRTFPIAVAIAATTAIVIPVLLVALSRDPTYRDATVLKICHGTTIYRLRDGRIVAQGGYRVENPETVCEAP